MEKPSVYLPIICYNQNVNIFFMLSLIELVILMKQKNYDISIDPIYFESLIPRARNAAASRFLDSKNATHLIFIDTDINFNPSDIIKLIEADKPVIGGVYPKKYFKDSSSKYPVDFTINGVVSKTSEPYIYEAEYIPTGFMCIKKEVLTNLISKKDLEYKNDIDGYNTSTNKFYNFFPCTIDPKTQFYLSEDYGFCNLCKEIDTKIYVYTDITLRHIGLQKYEGNLNDFLAIMKNDQKV